MNDAHRSRRKAEICRKLVLLLVALFAQIGHASVAIYVGKNLTRDGNVLLAGFGDEPSSHWLSIVPRQHHPAGETLAVGGTPEAKLAGGVEARTAVFYGIRASQGVNPRLKI